jgi:coenzyme F420-reducing hydrogenase alpha subunit
MSSYITEIVAVGTSIASAIVGWRLGGRQRIKNENNDAITRGADQIVDSSTKLMNRLEEMLEQERTRVEIEREHRDMCEKSLREHKEILDSLKKKVDYLERKTLK